MVTEKRFKLPLYLMRVPLGSELTDRLMSELFFYLNDQSSLSNRNIGVRFPNRFFYGPPLAFLRRWFRLSVCGFVCPSLGPNLVLGSFQLPLGPSSKKKRKNATPPRTDTPPAQTKGPPNQHQATKTAPKQRNHRRERRKKSVTQFPQIILSLP